MVLGADVHCQSKPVVAVQVELLEAADIKVTRKASDVLALVRSFRRGVMGREAEGTHVPSAATFTGESCRAGGDWGRRRGLVCVAMMGGVIEVRN